ncbi:MAG: hypothetical protein Q3990_04750 [Desulfovibrionaceae bacterium]|nr:hypothetical protein [Desulfovibrionaceae bacterium]
MEKCTLKKIQAGFAVLIVSAFCLFSFAQESCAAPKWIEISYSRPTLQIVGKDISKPGYLALRVSVHHENKSKNGEIITAIFDKKLKLDYIMDRYLPPNTKNECTARVQSSMVSKMHLYPGQKVSLHYLLPITQKGKITSNWRWLNEKILSDYKNGWLDDIFKKRKYSYEFQIKRDK